MNEQIQNLKDKIWADEYWTKPNTDKLLPAQLNRFAELIVGECIDIAGKEDFDFDDADNTVQIELTDEEFLIFAKMAHNQDITFNELVNKALADYLESIKDY